MLSNVAIGNKMYKLAERMFPLCRSITGNGFRESLKILQEVYPDLQIHEVPTGTKVFDWTVPKEWNIKDGYIANSKGERIVDFKKSNLHIVGYSTPVDKYVSLDELKQYVYTQEEQPDAVPYVTSYYKERFGFCMSQNQLDSLPEDTYRMVIDSELKNGSLTYGEILISGESEKEIFLSTYLCHPSMANNELSGPCVTIELAHYISQLSKRKYSYRIIFIPETIGSITYLSRNLPIMQQNMIAGWNLSCVGDDRTYSYVESRYGNTLADKVTKNVLRYHYPAYKKYSFLERGSDERQYNAPGVDLPVCAICRSKYGEYPEYHTSKDDMGLISPSGLAGAFDVYRQCIDALEWNEYYKVQCLCEPQLGKRGLYPTISQKGNYSEVRVMTDLIAYADGTNDLIDISNIIDVPVSELMKQVKKLRDNDLIKVCGECDA